MKSEIPFFTNQDAELIDEHVDWDVVTPEQKLAYFNNLATRPCPPMHYWRDILKLANHFAGNG